MKKLIILICLLGLAGCSVNPNNWHDTRATEVCGIVEGKITASLYVNGEMGGCKVVCSENAPKIKKLHYKSNFCEIEIGE